MIHIALRSVLVIAILLCVNNVLDASNAPPNIVLILADDLGWTDVSGPNLGPYTSDYYETPNLNTLAGEGMRFTNAYANPNCSPSRASLLTGRYSAPLHLTGVFPGGSSRMRLRGPAMNYPLPHEEVTVAELLKEDGYVTGLVGKWHLGFSHAEYHDIRQQGFSTVVPTGYVPSQGEWDNHLVDGLTGQAIQFIEQNKDEPFFLLLSHNTPHTPLTTRPDLLAKYQAKLAGTHHSNPAYAGLVEQLDESVGSVVAKIDELGLTNNTLIIFSSDNGGSVYSTSNAPLRGGKGHLYQGGIRVPTIFRLPGVIDAGSVMDTPIVIPDYMPTIMEFVGVDRANHDQLDGESLVPLLTKSGDLERQSIFWHNPHYNTHLATPMGAIRQGNWKLIEFFDDNRLELYNLAADIGEQNNLAMSQPAKAASLLAALRLWRKQVGADMPVLNPNWQAIQDRKKLRWAWDGDDGGKKPHKRWKTTIQSDGSEKSWVLQANSQESKAPELVRVSTHYRTLPDHAYAFEGTDNGMVFDGLFRVSSYDDYDDSAAIEIWFKLAQLQGVGQILFEAGSTNQGLSMTIGNANVGDQDGNNDDLQLRVMGGEADATIIVDLSQYADPSRDFMQLIAVANDGGSQNSVSLYLNGAKFDQVNLGSNDLDWDGPGGGAGLGLANGSVGASGSSGSLPFAVTDFEGQVAMFRVYEKAITDDQVLALYNYTLGSPDYHITSTDGNVDIPVARPASVDVGDEEHNSILMFHERQTILADELHVDLLLSAIEESISGTALDDMEGGVIGAGIEINSYFLHFDPIGNPADVVDVTVSVRFDDEIIGIINTTESLNASDFVLGVIGKYSKVAWRSFESDPLSGLAMFDDNHGLVVNLSAMGHDVDHLRVITSVSVVPLPMSGPMGLAILVGLAVAAKVRNRLMY